MNYSVYIFGELSAGYTQYPEDSSSDVLKGLYRQCKAPTQIVVRRDGSMMYYCYIRKLDGSKYIGISISINGFYISAISGMFSLYEKTIEKMAKQGVFVHFAPNGTLTTSLKTLKFETEEAEALIVNIRQNFENLASVPKPLPRTDFSIAKDSVKDFSVSDDKADIIKSSYTYGFTYIYKDKDFDTVRMNSYRSVLQRITDDNNSLKEANQKLQDEVAEVKRQKKQFKNVVILLLLVIGCGVGIYFLYDNLNATQSDLSATREHLDNANNEIAQKKDSLKTMSETIRTLQNSLSQEKSRCEEIEKTLSTKEDVLSKVESYMPIIITDVEIANVYNNGSYETGYGGSIYSSNTMYVKPRITYEGIKTGENINLRIKLYTPTGLSRGSSSPSDCSWAESMDVDEGNNTHSFQGWGGASKGHWSSGTYRYEFWYGNVCLKAKTFTIY